MTFIRGVQSRSITKFMRKLKGRGLLKSGVFLSCLCLCLLKSGAQGNLVQNGQFTSPNESSIPAWTYPGYIYVPGNPDVSGTDGASFVGISQYISQNLNTVPGQVYRLRFSIRASIPGMAQAGPNGVGVQWGGAEFGDISAGALFVNLDQPSIVSNRSDCGNKTELHPSVWSQPLP